MRMCQHLSSWAMFVATSASTQPLFLLGTGSVLPQAHLSRSGTWKARTWSKSSARRCPATLQQLHPNVSRWHGPLTARLCLPDTPTTLFASGKSPWPGDPKRSGRLIIDEPSVYQGFRNLRANKNYFKFDFLLSEVFDKAKLFFVWGQRPKYLVT